MPPSYDLYLHLLSLVFESVATTEILLLMGLGLGLQMIVTTVVRTCGPTQLLYMHFKAIKYMYV